jgi:hypothetical protein
MFCMAACLAQVMQGSMLVMFAATSLAVQVTQE